MNLGRGLELKWSSSGCLTFTRILNFGNCEARDISFRLSVL